MIGFNPLLDALMTQVQGNKSASPAQTPLNAPVHSVDAPQGNRQVHSDSRLNDMPSRAQHAQNAYSRAQRAPASPSAVIHLHPTAKAIADILLRFPLEMTLPPLRLDPVSVGTLMHSTDLARQLQASIVQSGLFFESHLARWYRGDYPKQLLMLEPQANPRMLIDSSAIPTNLNDVSERLSFLQRTQLELLNLPLIRTEGALIPGVFWHFDLFNYYRKTAPKPVLDYGQNSSLNHVLRIWRCLSRLKHPSFGYVDFDITIEGSHISVHFMSPSRLLMEYLRRDSASIVDLLKQRNIGPVVLTRETVASDADPQDFDHLISLNLVTNDSIQVKSQVDNVLSREYGSDAERILAQAKLKDIPAPMFTSLMPLLKDLDFDKDIPSSVFDILVVLSAWIVEQLPYMPLYED